MSTAYKTISEQRLEHLESLDRPLTDEESDDLRRALHAVHMNAWRRNRIAGFRKAELQLLTKVRAEAAKPEKYPHQ